MTLPVTAPAPAEPTPIKKGLGKKELIERIEGVQKTMNGLADSTSADTIGVDTATEMITLHKEMEDLHEQLGAVQRGEEILKNLERKEISKEIALGSDMHSDMASFLMDNLDGNLLNLGRDEIKIPYEEFFQATMMSDAATIVSRPNASGVPYAPRNRGTEIGAQALEQFAPTSFLDIITTRPSNDSKISYIEMNWGDQRPTVVQEGAAVPQSGYTPTLKTVNMAEYGFHTPVTRQSLRDVNELRGELVSMLRSDVRQIFDGLVKVAIATASVTTITETAAGKIIPQFISALDTASNDTYTPTQYIVCKGSEWSAIQAAAAAAVKTYDVSAYFTGRGRELHGTPVVISPAMNATEFIGGNFSQRVCEIRMRDDVRLSLGTVDDDFTKRQTRLMVEMEAVFILKHPTALARFKNNPTNTGGYL